jgi:hypothetical protein
MEDIEKEMNELTVELLGVMKGKKASIMIGACLNVIQTALNYNPSKEVGLAVSYSLRDIANKLQVQANELPH